LNPHGDKNKVVQILSSRIIWEGKEASLSSLRDVTERVAFEKEINQLNESIKVLNRVLRHDVLNSLTVVSMCLEMIETREETDKIKQKAFRAIQNSTELISKMKDVESALSSRSGLKEMDVRSILNTIIEDFKDQIEINISGNGSVLADDMITSVFNNIIRNAIIHGKTDKVDIGIQSKGKLTEITIRDYGVGIPKEIKEMIFKEEFCYGKNKGSGLGLYIVKKTIERYGGDIVVEENNPRGTQFILKIKKA
jgi:signal transduction histidine kinase